MKLADAAYAGKHPYAYRNGEKGIISGVKMVKPDDGGDFRPCGRDRVGNGNVRLGEMREAEMGMGRRSMEIEMTIAIICGMQTEASILNNPPGVVVIQGRNADRDIATDLEAEIAKGGVEAVMSFGVAGGLSPDLGAGDILVAAYVRNGPQIIAADWLWRDAIVASLSGAGAKIKVHTGVFCYSTGIVSTSAAKTALRTSSGADAVDMETWIAAQVAAKHGLPFAAVRTISDPVTLDDGPAASAAMTNDGGIDAAAVAGSLVQDPSQIGNLVSLGTDAEIAFNNLADVPMLLGLRFALPAQSSKRRDNPGGAPF